MLASALCGERYALWVAGVRYGGVRLGGVGAINLCGVRSCEPPRRRQCWQHPFATICQANNARAWNVCPNVPAPVSEFWPVVLAAIAGDHLSILTFMRCGLWVCGMGCAVSRF